MRADHLRRRGARGSAALWLIQVIAGLVVVGCAGTEPLVGVGGLDGDPRVEMVRLLADAGAEGDLQWIGYPECGPVDEPLGTFSISATAPEQPVEVALEVRELARRRGYVVEHLRSGDRADNFVATSANRSVTATYLADGGVRLWLSAWGLRTVPDGVELQRTFCG